MPDYSLPAEPPLLHTYIIIEPFINCEILSQSFVNELEDVYQKKEPPISVIEKTNSQDISNPDLVVRGNCQEKFLTITLEISKNRGSPEVFEPASFTFMGKIPSQSDIRGSKLFLIVNAFGLHLHRDYRNASKAFQTVAVLETNSKFKNELYFMQGNSFLFSYQYEEAKAAFQQANDPESARATHNLGVAHANIGWETGELEAAMEAFSQTLKLDPTFALAYFNRSQLRQWLGVRLLSDITPSCHVSGER